MHRVRLRRIKSTLYTALALLFVVLAGYGGYTLANAPLFDITEIRVGGNETISKDEIVVSSGLRIGSNLLKYSPDQVEEDLLSHPYIKTAAVSRLLPNKVNIKVSERRPMAIISAEERFLVLDDSGYCLAEVGQITAESRALPFIRCGAKAMQLLPGEKTEDKGVLAALALIKRLDPFFMECILEFEAPSAEKIAVINLDGLRVYFGQPEDLDRKLQHYEELLIKNAENCNANTVEYVDLRYDTQPTLKWK